ncbi:MAG: purine-nucleoside phosphorylase [Bacilli bacterium]|nr:purine-nucleoside phosphorylase [Bacilli bacterium]
MKPQEKPIHMDAKKGDIAPLVLLPGDPLRAKYIAENFLDDAKLVTSVRNMYGYTGYYKGKRVTVMSSGMGIASAGIYVFELFYYYGVEKIIRIGTCGAVSPDLKLLDVVLADSAYSETDFGLQFCNKKDKIIEASKNLNEDILRTSNELHMKINTGMINTTSVFGPYGDSFETYKRINNPNIIAEEMEGYAVFLLAKEFKKDASVILTIVDSPYDKNVVSIEDRQASLNNMIKLSLDSIIK